MGLPQLEVRRKPVRHGTFNEYKHHACRCEVCVAANTAYMRQYRADLNAARDVTTLCETRGGGDRRDRYATVIVGGVRHKFHQDEITLARVMGSEAWRSPV